MRSMVERARPVARSRALGLRAPPASVSRCSTATPRISGVTASAGTAAEAAPEGSSVAGAGVGVADGGGIGLVLASGTTAAGLRWSGGLRWLGCLR